MSQYDLVRTGHNEEAFDIEEPETEEVEKLVDVGLDYDIDHHEWSYADFDMESTLSEEELTCKVCGTHMWYDDDLNTYCPKCKMWYKNITTTMVLNPKNKI